MAARRLWIAFAIELAIEMLLLALYGGWTHSSLQSLIPIALLAIPVAMLLVRVLLVAASFSVSAVLDPPRSPLSALEWIRMLTAETASLARFQYLIMRGVRRCRWGNDGADEQSKPLLVLVHGIYCNGAIWDPLAAALAASTGCEVMTLSLEPVDSGLAEQEAAFSNWLDGIAGHRRIVVIAHSMGGLVARLYLQRHPGRKQIEQLICIGTPNAGSRIASALHSAIGRDLRIDSPALATLASAAGTDTMLDIVAEHDNLVIPASSCRRTGIETISIRGCGHLSLIYSAAVRKLLVAACRN